MNGLKSVIELAEKYGLRYDGIESGLVHFLHIKTKSTLAIELESCSTENLLSMYYRWEKRWFEKTSEGEVLNG